MLTNDLWLWSKKQNKMKKQTPSCHLEANKVPRSRVSCFHSSLPPSVTTGDTQQGWRVPWWWLILKCMMPVPPRAFCDTLRSDYKMSGGTFSLVGMSEIWQRCAGVFKGDIRMVFATCCSSFQEGNWSSMLNKSPWHHGTPSTKSRWTRDVRAIQYLAAGVNTGSQRKFQPPKNQEESCSPSISSMEVGKAQNLG